ncbi:MAG: hypothetical protein QF902_08660 [Rhodospirillales bacterium]|nr:hypothetical protein [Rhodospirillales bacterium]
MFVDGHLEKIERIERQRATLDPIADYELWYFASLMNGMHAMNAALHALGATVAEDCFAHNVPVYVRAGAEPGTWEAVIRPFGDLEHVDGADIMAIIPDALAPARDALLELETVRDPGLRGDLEITVALASKVEAAYGACLANAQAVIAKAGGDAGP